MFLRPPFTKHIAIALAALPVPGSVALIAVLRISPRHPRSSSFAPFPFLSNAERDAKWWVVARLLRCASECVCVFVKT